MALVNICDVTVLNNPSSFLKPFQFEITFECAEDLREGENFQISSADSDSIHVLLVSAGPRPALLSFDLESRSRFKFLG